MESLCKGIAALHSLQKHNFVYLVQQIPGICSLGGKESVLAVDVSETPNAKDWLMFVPDTKLARGFLLFRAMFTTLKRCVFCISIPRLRCLVKLTINGKLQCFHNTVVLFGKGIPELSTLFLTDSNHGLFMCFKHIEKNRSRSC